MPTRRSNPTRHAITTPVETELSDEKEDPESRVDGEHGETDLLDEKKLPKSRVNGEHEIPDET